MSALSCQGPAFRPRLAARNQADKGEPRREIVSGACNEPHSRTIPARENAKAIVAMAVSKLPVRSCLIDGEAIVCDENGLAVFDLIRGHGSKAIACSFLI